jgi:hypothetical protein
VIARYTVILPDRSFCISVADGSALFSVLMRKDGPEYFEATALIEEGFGSEQSPVRIPIADVIRVLEHRPDERQQIVTAWANGLGDRVTPQH